MIGFLVLSVAIFLFMLFGYSLLTAPFTVFMNISIIGSFIGMIALAIYGILWEFYFQKPAKTIIANRNAAAWEFAFDDVGYAELTPSKKYMPQGLVLWRFGWALLPRPIAKQDFIQKLLRKAGRKAKDPEKEKELEAQWQNKQEQEQEFKRREEELAEQIGLKKCVFKGLGKPIVFQYVGLAANFNPYLLVPTEIRQDNPHSYFHQFAEYINRLTSLSEDAKKDFKSKLEELQKHIDHVRLVIDPRRIKEIVPRMYTQGQLDDHGRIHERIGRLSVSGMPLGKIIILIVVVVGVLASIAAIYYLFMKPSQEPQQAAGLIAYVRGLL